MAKKLREIVVAVTADTAAYQREMNRASRMGGDYFKTLEQGAKRADAAYQRTSATIRMQVTAVSEATNAIGAYARVAATAFSAGKMVQYADSWTNLNNRLKLVTDGAQEFQAAQSAVVKISNDARAPLQSTAELYQRIATNQDALNLTGAGVASVVSTISKSLAISGTAAASADAALVQLGQAFASGVLRGEELNSVMEQAPGLAKAIADGLGIPIGELRAMGAAGQLTAQQVIGALQKMAGSIDTQFAKMQATVGQSLTVLQNATIAWVGHADEATGASKALAEGILTLANNLDSVATVGGAAALGALSAKLIGVAADTRTAVSAWRDARGELIGQAQAAAKVTAAQADHARMQLEVARANVAAANGMARLSVVQRELIPAQRAYEAATNAATAAQARFTSVSSVAAAAGRGLLGALGGPVGLAITLASVAAGWLIFRDNTDEATRSIRDMKAPLDDVVKKFGELNAQQRDQATRTTRSQLADAKSDMQAQLARLSGVAVNAASQSSLTALESFRAAIAAINADTSISAQEASQQIQAQIDAYVKATPVGAGYRDTLVDIAAKYSKSREESEQYTARLKAMEGAQAAAAATGLTLSDSLSAAAAGMARADWEKYLKNLEATRNLIGMSAREAGEYKARAEGANDAQALLAGTLTLQADTAEKLKKATADKDAKAIEGAKGTLLELVKVEAQQRAIIASAAEAARLQVALAKGSMTTEGFNQMVGEVYSKTYDKSLEEGQKRTASQIQGVATNTEASSTGKKPGEDWSKWLKERKAEVSGQLALAQAYGQGAAAVGAATVAMQAEEQVLRLGASHRAEIVKLLGEEAAARAQVDAAKQVAEMGKEIALIDAKTDAERMLWEVQSGAYSALDENIKKALVGRAQELDLAKKQAAQRAYIGQITGKTEADETLEKMGMLADAFDRNQISAEQYSRELAKLTTEGADDLTEFAVQGARNIQSYLGDGLYQAVTGKFEGIGSAFASMIARMASEAAAAQLGKALFGDFGSTNQIGGLFGSLGSAIGGMFGGGAGSASLPDTASWAMPKYAKGGAFTNGVVDSPTAFPMGLMGEAGPEAIMPLHRGADGSLGVRAEFPAAASGQDDGARVGGAQITINFDQRGNSNVQSSAGAEQFGQGLGRVVEMYVNQNLSKAFKPGGMLWNAQQGRRGG